MKHNKDIDFLSKIKYAFNGIYFILKEKSFRIEIIFACIAVFLSFILRVSVIESFIIWLCIGITFALEILNTAIEKICDYINKEENKTIGLIKDISSSSVLLFCMIDIIIGIVIFVPRLFIQIIY
jgi:diacylglycerol kinase